MKKLTKLAGTMPFAHLLGIRAADDTEDEDPKKVKRAEDDSDEAAKKAESDDDKPEDDKKEDAKRAESDKDEEPDGDEDDKEKMSDEEDDSKKDDKAKKAARNERNRCKAIVAHGVKVGRVVEACTFAFDTDMSVASASATLGALGAVQPISGKSIAHTSSLASRMAGVKATTVSPESGRAPDASSPQGVAAMVLAAGKKARGEA